MKKTTLVVTVLLLVMALAPAAAAAKPEPVHGTETFTLTPTCNPGAAFGGVDPADCRTAGPNVFLGLANPGFRDGTFDGTQFFDGQINAKANGDFTFRGILTFEGDRRRLWHGNGGVLQRRRWQSRDWSLQEPSSHVVWAGNPWGPCQPEPGAKR